jgi:hypothetical protein
MSKNRRGDGNNLPPEGKSLPREAQDPLGKRLDGVPRMLPE